MVDGHYLEDHRRNSVTFKWPWTEAEHVSKNTNETSFSQFRCGVVEVPTLFFVQVNLI